MKGPIFRSGGDEMMAVTQVDDVVRESERNRISNIPEVDYPPYYILYAGIFQ